MRWDSPEIRVARQQDRHAIIGVINAVGSEHQYLQTDHYCPNSGWELALQHGVSLRHGVLLLVVAIEGQIVGFCRLTRELPDDQLTSVGSVGIALLFPYRERGIGTTLLRDLVAWAPKLGFERLTANILATNERSLRLFRRRGFALLRAQEILVPYLPHTANELVLGLQLEQLERRGRL